VSAIGDKFKPADDLIPLTSTRSAISWSTSPCRPEQPDAFCLPGPDGDAATRHAPKPATTTARQQPSNSQITNSGWSTTPCCSCSACRCWRPRVP